MLKLTIMINKVNISLTLASSKEQYMDLEGGTMKVRFLEPHYVNKCPTSCPKPNCEGTIFLPHEEGWQCFNCMKIIYKATQETGGTPAFKRYQRYNN